MLDVRKHAISLQSIRSDPSKAPGQAPHGIGSSLVTKTSGKLDGSPSHLEVTAAHVKPDGSPGHLEVAVKPEDTVRIGMPPKHWLSLQEQLKGT
jgi:hypothetical protein